jgi:hypothetical protein
MVIFIWFVLLACAIPATGLSADDLLESGNSEPIRIEGKRFSLDSLTFQRSESWPGRRVKIQLLDGTTYQGRLLYVTDDHLFAGPDAKPAFSTLPLDSFAWSFRYDQIERVKVLGGANFWKGFGYAFAPIFALGVASGMNNDDNAWTNAAIFTAAAGIPLGLVGGALGAGENIKKNGPVSGIHESFRNRIPYWQKCARYKRKTPDMLP